MKTIQIAAGSKRQYDYLVRKCDPRQRYMYLSLDTFIRTLRGTRHPRVVLYGTWLEHARADEFMNELRRCEAEIVSVSEILLAGEWFAVMHDDQSRAEVQAYRCGYRQGENERQWLAIANSDLRSAIRASRQLIRDGRIDDALQILNEVTE